MPIFTVHEPPLARGTSDTDRFLFVRDGFHGWAMLLTPLWLVWNRLWLVFCLYLVVTGGGAWGLSRLGLSSSGIFAALALVSILIGLEASTLRRWTLGRRRWRNLGVVAADDEDAAERRFFDHWTKAAPSPPAPPSAQARPVMRRAAETGVIGLFPEPGARS